MFQSIQAKHRRYHWTWPGEKKKTESAGFIGSSGKGKDTWIILYALAKLKHKDKTLINLLGTHAARQNLDQFRPQGIANLAYSMGLLGIRHRDLLHAICGHVNPRRLEDFSEQEVSILTYGLALLRWRDPGLLSCICQHVLANAPDFKPRGLSSLFYSLSLLDFREENFFNSICDHIQLRLSSFNAQDISNTMYGLGLLEISHPSLLAALEEEMPGRLDEFTGQGLGNVVYSLGLLESESEGLLRAIATHMPTRFDDMTEQNISNIVWAMGNLGFVDSKLCVLLKGFFPMSSVKVRILEGPRRYDPEIETATERHWQMLLREKPQLFDGVVWCLRNFAVQDGRGLDGKNLLLDMQESTYKYSVYTHHSAEGQLLEASRRSGACGLMSLTQTKDGLLVFGRRSQYVGAFAGFYHCVPAGVVDVPDLQHLIAKELEEEIGADWKFVEKCHFMALLDTGNEQGHKYEFVLSMKLSLTAEEVYRRYQTASDKKEHENFLFINPELMELAISSNVPSVGLGDFLTGHYQITDVARRSLMLFQQEFSEDSTAITPQQMGVHASRFVHDGARSGLVVVQVLQGGLLSIGTPDMIQETLDFYRNASISSISSHVIRATRQAARTSNLRGGEEAEVTTKPIEMGQKKESKAKSPRGTDQIDARSPMADRMKARLSRTHGVSARSPSTDGIKARFPSDRDIESMVREGLYIESHEKLKESILWATEYENRSSKTVEQAVEEYKRRYQREPPASFGKWVDYALANKCEIDNYDMIEPYFQVFRKNGGITKEMVRAAMRLQSVGYYTINNNEIKDNGCWTYEFLGIILREFVHILSGTSFTFVVNCFDEPRFLYPSDLKGNPLSEPFDLAKAPDINKVIYDNANSIGKEILRNCWQIDRVRRNFNYHYFLTHANRPLQTQLGVIFSQATVPGCTTDIPIPANYHWGRRNATFADNATFDNKLHGFVWRGSSTGGEIQSRVIEWASHHRLRFQRLFGSSNNADVGITAIIQASSAKDVNKYHPTVNRTSEEAQATHKFLMDIDGNSFSQRFMEFAKKYNSAIIKATIFDEFALYTLRPWIDYVPIEFSYFNVDATVDWLEKHPQVPKRIAQHANEMGEKRLRVEDIKCYWARVLLEYRSLWRG
eukprot:symbB.v1.2.023147.t2/scaffold2098.1/size89601/8